MKVINNPTPNPYQPNQVEQSKSANKTTKTIGTEGVGAGQSTSSHASSGANIEISDNARLMLDASQIAKGAPDVRKERVAALKKSIQEGSYHVPPREIADRLVEEHLGSHFGKNSL